MVRKNTNRFSMQTAVVYYIFLFVVLKICELTQFFQKIDIVNPVMFGLGCILLAVILAKNRFRLPFKYPKLLWILIISLLITILFNLDIGTVKSVSFEIFYVVIIYIMARCYFTQEDYIKLAKIVVAFSFIIITIFFVKYGQMFLQNSNLTKDDIYNVVFTNINGGAILALLNVILVIYLYEGKQLRWHTMFFLCIYNTGLVMISKSRTTLYVLLFLAFLFLWEQVIRRKHLVVPTRTIKAIMTVSIIFVLLVVGVLGYIILKEEYDYSNSIDRNILELENKLGDVTSLRYWLWKDSIRELAENNVLFGIQANFGEHAFKHANPDLVEGLSGKESSILQRNNTHNGYVQVLVQNGIIGIILLMLYLMNMFITVMLIEDRNSYIRYIRYFYLFIFMINIFENHLLLSNSVFVLLLWVHLGMDARLLIGGKHEKNKRDSSGI